jgi:hypothetical protein
MRLYKCAGEVKVLDGFLEIVEFFWNFFFDGG